MRQGGVSGREAALEGPGRGKGGGHVGGVRGEAQRVRQGE